MAKECKGGCKKKDLVLTLLGAEKIPNSIDYVLTVNLKCRRCGKYKNYQRKTSFKNS